MRNNLNQILLRNFNSINRLPFPERLRHLKPLFDFNSNRSPYSTFTKEQKYNIDKSNEFFFKRLKKKTSVFNLNEWEKDFIKSRSYKKNICEYPMIDFHKSVQMKIEKEKRKNQKMYYNTAVNFCNNLFNKTKFKEVKLYEPKEKQDDRKIDTEHYLNGETEERNDDREFNIYFIINGGNKIKVENCKKNDFFFDVVDKLCRIDTNLEKDKIKTDEFTISGRTDGNDYIDYNDTLEGNRLEGNEEIIIKFKEEENNNQ